MANSSARKVMKSNQHRLNLLMLVIAIINILYGIVRIWFFRAFFIKFYRICWAVFALVYTLSFSIIWIAARPTFAADGSIVHGGEDISKPGLLEYPHDLIFLFAFAQSMLIFTRWALIILLVIPVYMIYFAVSNGMFSSSDDDVDESDETLNEYGNMSRKERRKAERQTRKAR